MIPEYLVLAIHVYIGFTIPRICKTGSAALKEDDFEAPVDSGRIDGRVEGVRQSPSERPCGHTARSESTSAS